MKLIWILAFFILTACGIEQEVPTETTSDGSGGGSDSQPVMEDAVFAKVLNVTPNGTKVQCLLNSILVDYADSIPVFIEFKGIEIERKVFKKGDEPVNFSHFNPDESGELVCVIEIANAEFESQAVSIEPQNHPGKNK